jgi:hypothetical protein
MTKTEKITAYNLLISDLSHKINSAKQQIEVIKFNRELELKGLKLAEILTNSNTGKKSVTNIFKDTDGANFAVVGFVSDPFRVTLKSVEKNNFIGEIVYLDDLEL